VLLEVASMGAYRPLWSSAVITELDRTLRLLLGKRGISQEETDAYLTRLFRQMETAFPDAVVTDWESLVETIQLPDPDDRHIVAAARAGRADVIVTDNLADFPPAALPAIAGRTGRSGPPMTARDIAAYLQIRNTPAFGERLLAEVG
jgi:PIN domain-containing protein